MSHARPQPPHLQLLDDAAETTPATPAPARRDVAATPRDVRIYTIRQVADLLDVAVSDVLELIRRGLLRARRVASSAVVTGDALAAFMATPDAASRFPSFTVAQPVVLAEDDGTLAFATFSRELDDGRVVVSRPGLLGRYEEAFAPEQVQPVTCRLPTAAAR